MPREIITIECTEARKEGKPPSRYVTTRNKKTSTDKLEIRKYNRFLRRHTLHREIK
jgi:large subunit ribosomal protein L33